MGARRDFKAGQELAVSRRTLSQDQLDLFGVVGGSNGRIHIDAEWATPRYGSTIAQGMLVLGPVARIMAEACGEEAWLTAGSLEAKFVGLARPGDVITVRVVVDAILKERISCAFSCVAGDGRTVIVGTAAGRLSP